MTAEKTSGAGAGALVGGGTALALVLVALGWWVVRDNTPTDVSDTPFMAQEGGQTATERQATENPTEEAGQTPPEAMPETYTPQFDVVRVEPDGSAVIAGQAKPGAKVQLLLDGQAAGQTKVDSNGNFVALLSLPPSDAPRVMELMVDGEKVKTADQSVIVGPITAPTQIATAEPPASALDEASEESAPSKDVAEGTSEGAMSKAAPVETIETAKVATAEGGNDAPETAPAAPQVLLADQDGIKVLQDAGGAAAPDQTSLDSIAYDALGAVILAGRGAANSAVQVYLDGAELAQTVAGEDGQWRLKLPSVEPGVYDLRVDVLDKNGAVVSRVETPFKREDAAKFAALALQAGNAQPVIEAQASATQDDPLTSQAPEMAAAARDVAGDKGTDVAGDATGRETTVAMSSAAQAAEKEQISSGPEATSAAVTETNTSSGAGEVAAQDAQSVPSPRPKLITVQPGATLWAIARDTLGEGTLYVQVFDANRTKIRNPDLIYPGQVFSVPLAN